MFDLHSLEDYFEFSFSDFPCFNERYTCLNGEGADNNKRYAIIERLPIVIHHESQTDEQESSSACSTEDGKQSFGDDFLQSFWFSWRGAFETSVVDGIAAARKRRAMDGCCAERILTLIFLVGGISLDYVRRLACRAAWSVFLGCRRWHDAFQSGWRLNIGSCSWRQARLLGEEAAHRLRFGHSLESETIRRQDHAGVHQGLDVSQFELADFFGPSIYHIFH